MSVARIAMPTTARKGEVILIRTIVQHPMETGYRRDHLGRPIKRNIINRVTVTYGGAEIFRMECFPGIAANPYIAFRTIATETGDIVFTWVDDEGKEIRQTMRLVVT